MQDNRFNSILTALTIIAVLALLVLDDWIMH